tara:strand:+ start:11005 stop:11340 length:336 start_codon:yes stop_codon:yes gene_type:complete
MSEDLKGNWRSYSGYKFLSSLDFEEDQENSLTIENITKEEAIDPNTKKSKSVIAIKFIETDRLMVLNKTNAKRITEIFKTPQVGKWKGHKITIRKEPIKAFGRQQHCLRVK